MKLEVPSVHEIRCTLVVERSRRRFSKVHKCFSYIYYYCLRAIKAVLVPPADASKKIY